METIHSWDQGTVLENASLEIRICDGGAILICGSMKKVGIVESVSVNDDASPCSRVRWELSRVADTWDTDGSAALSASTRGLGAWCLGPVEIDGVAARFWFIVDRALDGIACGAFVYFLEYCLEAFVDVCCL